MENPRILLPWESHTVELGYNELPGKICSLLPWFVITVKIYVLTCHLGPDLGQFFARYKRECVITVIVISDFYCKINLIKLYSFICFFYCLSIENLGAEDLQWYNISRNWFSSSSRVQCNWRVVRKVWRCFLLFKWK